MDNLEIKTTEEIQEWKQQPVQSDYNLKWVRIANILERINHIKDVIRRCSWEDELGEQTLHYSDLHNLFKILEGELNKPEVNKPSLSQNNKKEDGIPPTNKLVGILPKRL